MENVDDALLDAIAQQAREAYAHQQLGRCITAIRYWQNQADHDSDPAQNQVAHQVIASYAGEFARWQAYLGELHEQVSIPSGE